MRPLAVVLWMLAALSGAGHAAVIEQIKIGKQERLIFHLCGDPMFTSRQGLLRPTCFPITPEVSVETGHFAGGAGANDMQAAWRHTADKSSYSFINALSKFEVERCRMPCVAQQITGLNLFLNDASLAARKKVESKDQDTLQLPSFGLMSGAEPVVIPASLPGSILLLGTALAALGAAVRNTPKRRRDRAEMQPTI